MKLRLALAVLLFAASAHADVTAAARAFAEGQAAQLEGDYERAAQNFELAYTIQPSKEALRSAVRARQLDNQLPRAATLAELLLANYGTDETSATLAKSVIAEAKPKLARLLITCTEPCTVAVGGRAVSLIAATKHAVFLSPGMQELDLGFAKDLSATRKVDVKAGEESSLTVPKPEPMKEPDQPPPPPPPPVVHDEPHGLSPIFVMIGGGLTVATTGFAIWSGVNTLTAHDQYVDNPTDSAYDAGRRKQLRTNIAIGAAAGFGVTTAVLAIFFTKWHDKPIAGRTDDGGVTVGVAHDF